VDWQVIEGYLEVSTTKRFVDAAQMGAKGATAGSLEVRSSCNIAVMLLLL